MSGPSERDEIAAVLALNLNIVGPLRQVFGAHSTSKELLDALEVLMRQEIEALADVLAERDRRTAAKAWFAGYDKGNLDGYFGTNDERAKSPYADLDPCREEPQ